MWRGRDEESEGEVVFKLFTLPNIYYSNVLSTGTKSTLKSFGKSMIVTPL